MACVYYHNNVLSTLRKEIRMKKSHQEQIRRRVAAAMGRETVPDAAWEILLAKGHVQEFVDGDIGEEAIVQLATVQSFYADLVEQIEAGVEPEDGGWEVRPPRADGYEADRARTLESLLEMEVAADPGVLRWRKSCLDTTRPAPVEQAYLLTEDSEFQRITSGLPEVRSDTISPSGSLPFYDRSGQIRHVVFYPGSDLENLRERSEEMRDRLFPLWTLADAAWIVVTGKAWQVPTCLKGEIEGFSNQHLTYGRINLSVEPWITGETVLRAYQHLQALALPRRPRALSERNLAMTRFVMEHLRHMIVGESEDGGESPRVSWHRLAVRWNREHPEWAFRDERNFFRDCRRTVSAVARPYDEKRLEERSVDHPLKVSIP